MWMSCSVRLYLSCCCLLCMASMFSCNLFNTVINLQLSAFCCVDSGVVRVCC